MSLTPKNWSEFQHYKDRAPVWIKLHRSLLDNYEFHCLQVASKALAPMLWLLASEYDGGKITATIKEIAFRLHMSESDLETALKPLIGTGFFIDDSNMLAGRYQDAIPEKRREEIQEREEIEGGAIAPAENVITIVGYKFEGRVIRLKSSDYDRWRGIYSAIEDFDASLQAADDYYSENPPKDGKWFFPVSRWLAKEHAAVRTRGRSGRSRIDEICPPEIYDLLIK